MSGGFTDDLTRGRSHEPVAPVSDHGRLQIIERFNEGPISSSDFDAADVQKPKREYQAVQRVLRVTHCLAARNDRGLRDMPL